MPRGVAAERLQPAQHVGPRAYGRFGANDHPIGIVIPFLLVAVAPDERFWLMMYPGMVKNLRNLWNHPDVPDERPEGD